ncbi:hypothetical protein GCM10020255_002070 [Rhodococcus baikonurensis]
MAPTATRTTRRSSDLSKHSAEVFAEAEDHPVTVTRRDGEDLVLMTQREADSRARLLEFAAQLIGVAVDDDGPLDGRMSRAFPGCWHFPRRIVPSALETWSTPHARRSRPTNRTWYLRN